MDRLTLAPLSDFDLGALFAGIIAFVAYRAHALTGGGALAAAFVGTAVYGSGNLPYAGVLLAFFISSVALSRFGKARKSALLDAGKHGPRDGAQVLANGGVAALCAVLGLHGAHGAWSAAFAGAFAAATADTWGTEIGTLFGGTPRSILTLRELPVGLSGGITRIGTLAELAGALFIALAAAGFAIAPLVPVLAGGITGALVDSLLGASVQTLRWCPQCRRPCETEPHACGANTSIIRGLQIISNDVVNFLATLAGAVTAYSLFSVGRV